MGAVDHDSPKALFALMLTLPAQVIVGHTPPVIEEEGQLQLPFLAHSRHGASYHRKSAHFSRNGRDGRIAVFGVMFRGDFQGKYGHRAALKCPIVFTDGADYTPPICRVWVAFWYQFCRVVLLSFLPLNLTAAFRSRWYARCGQGSSISLPQVVALHRRGAYPIRPVIRLEIIHR